MSNLKDLKAPALDDIERHRVCGFMATVVGMICLMLLAASFYCLQFLIVWDYAEILIIPFFISLSIIFYGFLKKEDYEEISHESYKAIQSFADDHVVYSYIKAVRDSGRDFIIVQEYELINRYVSNESKVLKAKHELFLKVDLGK